MDTNNPEQGMPKERADFLFKERFEGFMPWLTAARDIQTHSDDPLIASDLAFFESQFAMAAPNVTSADASLNRVMHVMQKGQDAETEYWSLIYLLNQDIDYIGSDKQVNAVLKGSDGGASTTAGVFNEKHKYIALSGAFEASDWVRGILFLHELRHAHAYYDGQYKDAGQHAHWIEETEVWLYEFGLFEAAKPHLWQNLVMVTKNTLKLSKDIVSFPPATPEMKVAISALDAGPPTIDSFISTVSKAQALYEAVRETENEGRAKNELATYLKNSFKVIS